MAREVDQPQIAPGLLPWIETDSTSVDMPSSAMGRHFLPRWSTAAGSSIAGACFRSRSPLDYEFATYTRWSLASGDLGIGGDAGIRTLDTGFGPYAPLAGECLRPLGHVSVLHFTHFRHPTQGRASATAPSARTDIARAILPAAPCPVHALRTCAPRKSFGTRLRRPQRLVVAIHPAAMRHGREAMPPRRSSRARTPCAEPARRARGTSRR